MISAVARIMQPGYKVDHVLVLVGDQDLNKSTSLRVLAGDDFFSDMPIVKNINSSDMALGMRGKWIIELEEIDRVISKDSAEIKAFITRQDDTFRPPYGRSFMTKGRHCVYAATTNLPQFLKDLTGNRRYWPIAIKRKAKIGQLRELRDQLWAEALYLYNDGEPWHIVDQQIVDKAKGTQAEATVESIWDERVEEYIEGRNFVKNSMEVIHHYTQGRDMPQWVESLVKAALLKRGFEQKRVRMPVAEGGKLAHAFVRHDPSMEDSIPLYVREPTKL